jgi:DNA-binding NtrC family response regulator
VRASRAEADDDLRVLAAYDWPGNVRELAAVIERAAILGDGHRLEVRSASALLGLNPSTLRSRMERLGIDWRTFRAEP